MRRSGKTVPNGRKKVSEKRTIIKKQPRSFPQVTSLLNFKAQFRNVLHKYEEEHPNSKEIITLLNTELNKEFSQVAEKIKEQHITSTAYRNLISKRKDKRAKLLLALKKRLVIHNEMHDIEKQFDEEENQRKEKEVLHNYLNTFETFFHDIGNNYSIPPPEKEFEISENFEDTILSITETQSQLQYLKNLNSSIASFIDNL